MPKNDLQINAENRPYILCDTAVMEGVENSCALKAELRQILYLARLMVTAHLFIK